MATVAVTGTASGIGQATADLLEERGDRVVRVDLREGDVCVDLSSPSGREAMVEGVSRASGGHIDGIIACAGLSPPWAEPAAIVKVNYFGALATLEGLRPLLAGSPAPRAVAVSSWASIQQRMADLERALLEGDEHRAVHIAEERQSTDTYATTKAALSRWMRRKALAKDWLGSGILLNAVAPGLVATPMTRQFAQDPAARAQLEQFMPLPLGRDLQAIELARVLAWLVGPDNTVICGQVIFADGGSEVATRGDQIW